jgi:phosphatidylserine decarboxylase
MAAPVIRFYNRYTGQHETEKIYGERWLRLMYDNPAGKLFLWLIVKRAIF